MSDQLISIPVNQSATDSEKIYLLDMVIMIARKKRLIVGTTLMGGAAALVFSLLQAPVFTSTAKILPPQQPQSSGVSAMLGQLGGLAGVAGGSALKNPGDLYVGLLESRTVSDNIIARFKLKARYATATMDATRRMLAINSEIAIGKKDGIIAVGASDKDPQFAADLANAYVDELAKLTQTMSLTEASQRRIFFEKQLQNARDQLSVADSGLRQTQEATGMIQPEGQVQAIIGNLAQLKASIAAKEVQLNAMRTFATDSNPEVRRAQGELSGMRQQLAKLEQRQPAKKGDFLVPTSKIPEVGAEYVHSVRNVKYSETIYEVLAKQYELARIDEAKESTQIQLLDKALPAEVRTKPRRTFMTLAGVLGGFVLGLVIALCSEAYRRSRQTPEGIDRWRLVSAAWKRKG